MTKTSPDTLRRSAITLLACLVCALCAGLVAQAPDAGAQAVTEEYELGPLPDSDGESGTTAGAQAPDASDEGSPLVWIVIGVGAVLGIALGAWYVSRHRKPGEPSTDPPSGA